MTSCSPVSREYIVAKIIAATPQRKTATLNSFHHFRLLFRYPATLHTPMRSTMNNSEYRMEKDSIGKKAVPKDVYYGIQSLRAAENFHITGISMHPEFINSLAYIKKACAITNCETGMISKRCATAIVQACDELLEGKLQDQFIVDPIQGGAGTSYNMNANEVIANRANEILGGEKGVYDLVHPNNHVNFGQSTNDVIPTAGKMTALKLLEHLKQALILLEKALRSKGQEFNQVIKMGRTQMQDAVPILKAIQLIKKQENKKFHQFTT